MATEEQVKTAELQRTPHTPAQMVAEMPVTKEASLVYDVPSPLWYHRLGPVKDLFRGFSRLQRKRPLTVAVGTSVTTYFCGDILAQEISGDPYDWKRTARMLLVGCVASIPGYKWFLYLGSHFNYGGAALSISIKVLIQQIVFAPVFNTYFFGMQALFSGETMHGVIHRIKTAVPEAIWSSAKFWPLVTALNFTLIPAHLRFGFSGVFAVVWQTYLSFLNRKKEEKDMADVRLRWTELGIDAKERAGERLDEAGIPDMVEDMKEKVGDAVEDVKEKVEDMKDKVSDVVEDAKDKVTDAVQDVKDKVGEAVDDAKEKVSDVVQDAKDKVSEVVEDTKDKFSEVLGIGDTENNDQNETDESELVEGDIKNHQGTAKSSNSEKR